MTNGRTHQQEPHTMVAQMIKAGFGVEDIHVKTGLHLDSIRFILRSLRATGRLAQMFKR